MQPSQMNSSNSNPRASSRPSSSSPLASQFAAPLSISPSVFQSVNITIDHICQIFLDKAVYPLLYGYALDVDTVLPVIKELVGKYSTDVFSLINILEGLISWYMKAALSGDKEGYSGKLSSCEIKKTTHQLFHRSPGSSGNGNAVDIDFWKLSTGITNLEAFKDMLNQIIGQIEAAKKDGNFDKCLCVFRNQLLLASQSTISQPVPMVGGVLYDSLSASPALMSPDGSLVNASAILSPSSSSSPTKDAPAFITAETVKTADGVYKAFVQGNPFVGPLNVVNQEKMNELILEVIRQCGADTNLLKNAVAGFIAWNETNVRGKWSTYYDEAYRAHYFEKQGLNWVMQAWKCENLVSLKSYLNSFINSLQMKDPASTTARYLTVFMVEVNGLIEQEEKSRDEIVQQRKLEQEKREQDKEQQIKQLKEEAEQKEREKKQLEKQVQQEKLEKEQKEKESELKVKQLEETAKQKDLEKRQLEEKVRLQELEQENKKRGEEQKERENQEQEKQAQQDKEREGKEQEDLEIKQLQEEKTLLQAELQRLEANIKQPDDKLDNETDITLEGALRLCGGARQGQPLKQRSFLGLFSGSGVTKLEDKKEEEDDNTSIIRVVAKYLSSDKENIVLGSLWQVMKHIDPATLSLVQYAPIRLSLLRYIDPKVLNFTNYKLLQDAGLSISSSDDDNGMAADYYYDMVRLAILYRDVGAVTFYLTMLSLECAALDANWAKLFTMAFMLDNIGLLEDYFKNNPSITMLKRLLSATERNRKQLALPRHAQQAESIRRIFVDRRLHEINDRFAGEPVDGDISGIVKSLGRCFSSEAGVLFNKRKPLLGSEEDVPPPLPCRKPNKAHFIPQVPSLLQLQEETGSTSSSTAATSDGGDQLAPPPPPAPPPPWVAASEVSSSALPKTTTEHKKAPQSGLAKKTPTLLEQLQLPTKFTGNVRDGLDATLEEKKKEAKDKHNPLLEGIRARFSENGSSSDRANKIAALEAAQAVKPAEIAEKLREDAKANGASVCAILARRIALCEDDSSSDSDDSEWSESEPDDNSGESRPVASPNPTSSTSSAVPTGVVEKKTSQPVVAKTAGFVSSPAAAPKPGVVPKTVSNNFGCSMFSQRSTINISTSTVFLQQQAVPTTVNPQSAAGQKDGGVKNIAAKFGPTVQNR